MRYEIVCKDLSFFLTFISFGVCFFLKSAFGYHGCPKPADPAGGGKYTPEKESYNVNDTVLYGCPTKLYQFGSKTRTCLSDGTWSESVPYCVKSLNTSGTNEDNAVLFDNDTRTCLYIKGDRQRSIYIEIKGKHQQIIVKIISNRNRNKFGVYYVNHQNPDNHQIFKFLERKSEDTDGLYSLLFRYNISFPVTNPNIGLALDPCYPYHQCKVCEVVIVTDIIASCSRLYPLNEDTFITFDKEPSTVYYFDYGSAATFHCSEGYQLVGNKTRRCDDNGEWTGMESFCKAAVCSQEPPFIQNVFWPEWQDGKSYHFNHSLKGVCKDGYRIYGRSPIATCTSEGAWSIDPSGILCRKIECSEKPPELKNGNWSRWENGKAYPFKSTLEATCKYGYINNAQPIIVTCNTIGTWSPEFLENSCQELSAVKEELQSTVTIAVAVVGLIFILLGLGLCIFWKRGKIFKRSQKRIHQENILLKNPIYNSTSSSLQGEECTSPVYLQPQINSTDSDEQYSYVSNEEILNTGMVKNELYFTECPMAKAIHAYSNSLYEEVHKDEQSKPNLTSQPIGERPMQEIVVENEIYGTE